MNYAEKLKDPRWQKKRLEMLESFGWTCKKCGDKENALNVHHRLYFKNTEPWDYEDWAYVVLCDECHDLAHHLHQRRLITMAKSGAVRGLLDWLDGVAEEDIERVVSNWLQGVGKELGVK